MPKETPSNGDAINQNGGLVDTTMDDGELESSNYDSEDGESNEHTVNQVTWTCRNCSLLYNKHDKEQKWISCAICVANFDTACLRMSKTTFKTLNKTKNAFWLCDHCRDTYMPNQDRGLDLVKYRFKAIGEKIRSINKATNHIASLQEQLKQTCVEITSKFESSIKAIETNICTELDKMKTEVPEEANRRWANMVKANPTPQESVTLQHVKTAIREASALDKEMEVRSRGIVIYRAPESNKTTSEERKADDLQLLTDLLAHIKCEDTQMISSDRLGKFDKEKEDKGKHRPIKVRFVSNQDRDKVLRNLFRLRDAEAKLNKLSIRQDLNESQRAELNAKLAEAYEKTKTSQTKVYRVRGNPGDYSLKEFPKKQLPNETNKEPQASASDQNGQTT